MRFRPCIDIHNGKVKQIVGSTLNDSGSSPEENFVSEKDAAYYACMYREKSLPGGHIIMLNKSGTDEYEADKKQTLAALAAFKGGMQAGGGITAENAREFLNAGASHVIVTSYVFKDGKISFENLERLVRETGKERLVLDLSCRKKDGKYYIVTDRWQRFTDTELNRENLEILGKYCDEFLVHAADAEGKQKGIEENAAALMAEYSPVTAVYAGGIGEYEDIIKLKKISGGRLDFTVGSALDMFGGKLKLDKIIQTAAGDTK